MNRLVAVLLVLLSTVVGANASDLAPAGMLVLHGNTSAWIFVAAAVVVVLFIMRRRRLHSQRSS